MCIMAAKCVYIRLSTKQYQKSEAEMTTELNIKKNLTYITLTSLLCYIDINKTVTQIEIMIRKYQKILKL